MKNSRRNRELNITSTALSSGLLRAPSSLLLALCALLLALCLPAQAQEPKKVPRIGYLSSQLPTTPNQAPRLKGFQQGLRELGYVDGQNIVIEYRWAERKPERLPKLAADLVRTKVDIILLAGEEPIRAAKQATNTIPIVVANSGDLVGPGHVASLARPGGNITGLVTMSPELSTKRLEILKETLPKLSRVAVLWNPANSVAVQTFKETMVVASSLNLQIQSVEVRSPKDFDRAFLDVKKDRAGALLLVPESLISSQLSRIVDFTRDSHLPVIHQETSFADMGGLMVYGPNQPDMFRRAAYFVDKILKGAKPSDLPIEQPTKFEFVVNLKTAKQIGLTIPPTVLARADRVIK